MENLLVIVQSILNLGAAIMLPIMIVLLGLLFGMKFGRALKAGLLVGIGFQGLGLVIGLLSSSISPAITHYQQMGGGFTTVDVGWAAVGAASWSVPFAALAIILIVVINLLLLLTKKTKVMNVDIWNFIHFLIPGALAYALFNNFWLGLIVTVGLSVITLFIAEKVAPTWQEYFGLEGTTCTTFSFITFAYPFGLLINKIIDVIPGLNKVDLKLEKLESKIGFFGDTAVIGLLVGVLLGFLSSQSWQTSLQMGAGISAVLVLLPKMVSVMMEGLTAIGEAARFFMKRKLGADAELYVGMDIALALGDPTCVTTTVLLIPVAILLAFVIPNMNYFPIGILTVIVYMIPFIALACKGNLLRTLIASFLFLVIVEIGANVFAPEATAMMNATGIQVSGMVTDGFWGFNLANIVISFLSRLF